MGTEIEVTMPPMLNVLQILLSFLSTTGLCAGAEVLSAGTAIWCPHSEDAVYTYVANEYEPVEHLPQNYQTYVLDWNFVLFKANKCRVLNRDIYILRQGENNAGVMVVDEFSHFATGEIFKIEARYNFRGQLVYARIKNASIN